MSLGLTGFGRYILTDWLIFSNDGGKPYGRHVELLLTFTNRLNLQLEIEEGNSLNACFDKMRSGEIDIMVHLSDKDDRRDYMEYIPYHTIYQSIWRGDNQRPG